MDNGASSYRRFLEGDDNGLVEIIRDYKDGLLFYLNSFVQNFSVAEELTEETFVKLAIRKSRFWGRCAFKTWLYTIGRNQAIDYLRRHAHTDEVPWEDVSPLSRDEEDLERSYLKEERKILLHHALNRINAPYRQVLYLAYFEDFSHAEMAAILKKNRRQIENLLYRAKLALKQELNKEGFRYEDL